MLDGNRVFRKLVLTNVESDALAACPAVRRFMTRIAEDFRAPTSGAVMAESLAEATANVFELHEPDGFGIPPRLYALASEVSAKLAATLAANLAAKQRG